MKKKTNPLSEASGSRDDPDRQSILQFMRMLARAIVRELKEQQTRQRHQDPQQQEMLVTAKGRHRRRSAGDETNGIK